MECFRRRVFQGSGGYGYYNDRLFCHDIALFDDRWLMGVMNCSIIVIFFTRIFSTRTQREMAKRTDKNNMMVKQKEALFAKNFRKARKEAGYRQQDIVDKTGLTRTFIVRIEGKKQSPSLGNAIVLAEAVGEPLCSLLSSVEK